MKKHYLIFTLFFIPFLLLAQPKKWDAGIFLGLSNYEGDLVEPTVAQLNNSRLAYGVFAHYLFNPSLGMRFNILSGGLAGDDLKFDNRVKRAFNFKTQISELSAQVEWDLLGKKRYQMRDDSTYNFKKTFSPYLFVGAGAAIFNPKTDFSQTSVESLADRIQQDQNADYSKIQLAIPIGGGFKWDLNSRTQMGVELGLRTAFTDYLDGVSISGNPDRNDWYLFGGIFISKRLGGVDSDNDGIVDKEDSCPEIRGVDYLGGCPDSDKDGIGDADDDCPRAAGSPAMGGCPDTDGDGIVDKDDQCPNEKGSDRLEGCPDRDDDGIADKDDDCPDEAGVIEKSGCPVVDTDGDGIADEEDKCPTEAGEAELGGCPNVDQDNDGVRDEEDACPTVPGLANMKGCPDSDSDGVADNVDNCPNIAGLPINKGCPVLKEEEKEVLNLAMKNVRFRTNSAVLLPESFPILDQILDIMNRYPNYNLNMTGYTDSVGIDSANQQLSEKRARACLQYLRDKGVAAERMTAIGRGETNPIASNKNERGRRQNRRVEFELVQKR